MSPILQECTPEVLPFSYMIESVSDWIWSDKQMCREVNTANDSRKGRDGGLFQSTSSGNPTETTIFSACDRVPCRCRATDIL